VENVNPPEPASAERDASELSRARAATILVALALVAAALRLHRLTFQSLWYDELFSVVFSHPRLTPAEIVAKYSTDVHPLGYPLLLHAWMKLWGATDFVARLLSVFAGTASVIATYFLGRALGGFDGTGGPSGRRVGLFAALVVTVDPFHIYYSQEARSYAVLFALSALSFTALVGLVRRPSFASAALYAGASALVLHCHYYGVVLVAAQLGSAALLVVVRRRALRPLAPLAVAAGLVAVAALPWIVPLARAASRDKYWPPVPGWLFALDYFHEYFGSVPLAILAALLLLSLPFTLPRAPAPGSGEPGRNAALLTGPRPLSLLFALTSALCLAVPYLWSRYVLSMMQTRFSMVFLPALFALVALAMAALPRRFRGLAAAAFAAFAAAELASGGYYTTVRNEQWREAGRWAFREAVERRPADRFAAELAPGFQFYFDQDGFATRVEETSKLDLAKAARELRGRGGLWLLVARGRRGDAAFTAELERRFEKTAERRLVGAAAELWRPRAGKGAKSRYDSPRRRKVDGG